MSHNTVVLCIQKCLRFGIEAALGELPRPGKQAPFPMRRLPWSGVPYPEGQAVGKKLNLLSRKKRGSLSGRYDKFFERLNQAQNSAFDVIQFGARASDGEVIEAVVPNGSNESRSLSS